MDWKIHYCKVVISLQTDRRKAIPSKTIGGSVVHDKLIENLYGNTRKPKEWGERNCSTGCQDLGSPTN